MQNTNKTQLGNSITKYRANQKLNTTRRTYVLITIPETYTRAHPPLV